MSDRKLDLTLGQLDRLANFYPRVDGKAAFLLALNVGLASILILNVDFPSEPTVLPHGLAIVCGSLLGLSCIELSVTFLPHLRGGIQKSHLYFGDIANYKCEEFYAIWNKLSTADRIRDASIQIWRNSEILRIKYRSCERAFKLSFIAIIPWIVVMINVIVMGQQINLS